MPKGVHAGCPTVPLFILPWGTLQPVSSRLDSQEGRGRGRQPTGVTNIEGDSLQEVSFSSVRAFQNSDRCSLEGTSSNPPVCPSQGASVHHPLPEDWPVPQALHGPAYLSAETSSAVMAAVAVDSAAIVPLRWWASGRDTACEKNRRNSGRQSQPAFPGISI